MRNDSIDTVRLNDAPFLVGYSTPSGGTYDYERIRRVVLQVIEERERQLGVSVREVTLPEEKRKETEPEPDMLTSLDDDALNGIMASLAAFKQQ